MCLLIWVKVTFHVIDCFIFTGQQVFRLPDGRLQLITMPQQKVQQQATATAQTVTSGIQVAKPAAAVQVPVAQTQVRPQTVLVNSAGTPVSVQPVVSGVTPTKIMVASQGGVQSAVLVSSPQSSAGTVSVLTSGGQGIARIISPAKIASPVIQKVAAGTSVVQVNTPQGTRIIRQVTPQIVVSGQQQPNLQQKQQQLQQQQQVLAAQQAQLQQVIQQQQLKLQSGQVVQVSAATGGVTGATAILSGQSGQQTITVTPQQLAALQQQQQLKLVKAGDSATQSITIQAGDQQTSVQAGASIQDQLAKQLQPESKTGAQSAEKSAVPGSPPPVSASQVKSPIAVSAQQKYAVTPQVVQEGNLFYTYYIFCSKT